MSETDQNTQQPTAEQIAVPPVPSDALPTVLIPQVAVEEIINLHTQLVSAAQIMEQRRSAFNEFIRAARLALGIPTNEIWDLLPNASAFRKSANQQLPYNAVAPASNAASPTK